MRNLESIKLFAHGYEFKISKNQFGYNITHAGKWLWRSKTISEAKKIIRIFGINYMKEANAKFS